VQFTKNPQAYSIANAILLRKCKLTQEAKLLQDRLREIEEKYKESMEKFKRLEARRVNRLNQY